MPHCILSCRPCSVPWLCSGLDAFVLLFPKLLLVSKRSDGRLHLDLETLKLFDGSRTESIIVFFANAIKFGTSVCFSCIFIAPGVISIIGNRMEYASGLPLKCVNFILEP